MSTETNTATSERLNSIERRLKQMVERKWTPLREKTDSEPMEVWTEHERVYVGHTYDLRWTLLTSDVIRTFDKGYYDIEGGTKVSVRPKSASEFYETRGMDVRRAAVIEALDETGLHVPKVTHSRDMARMKHFETREEAERAATVLEGPIEERYEMMCNSGVEELEIKEFEEPRDWLAPDPCYSVIVHFE